ncbi:MAG TPA: nuclear transport factor 2 family protein, partial [Candidatus Eremiobacteraceae bacterium]|nr:nuclear transport factor 2 family protein [Candidatus Eremiobacteraceae bacterium]
MRTARARLGALFSALVLTLAAAAFASADPARAAGAVVTHADGSAWAAAWNSHDIDTVLKLFAQDVRIDQPENPKPLTYAGARGFFTMIFRAYPDFHIDVR